MNLNSRSPIKTQTVRHRIVMITGRADPGGGPEHVLQLSRQLLGTCEIFIASPQEHPYWNRYVELVGASRVFEIPHRKFSRSSLRELDVWCRSNQIDVVHSHGRAAGTYSRLLPRTAGRVCVHTAHGSLQLKSVKDFAYWFAEFILTRRTDQTIAVSESEAQQLRRLLLTGDRLKTIPNGVVVPSSSTRATNPGSAPLRIIHITRFVPQKNSSMVLAILSSLRQKGALDRFHVDMLGDGPERQNLEQEIQRLGLKNSVTFHGAQPSVIPYLAKGFCVLTTSRWEGMPLAVLESLANGLPAIGSDTPGNNDVISNKVGRLFALNDPAAAADHLMELAMNPVTWKQLSTAAVEMVQEKFSVQRMGADTEALYENINPSQAELARKTG